MLQLGLQGVCACAAMYTVTVPGWPTGPVERRPDELKDFIPVFPATATSQVVSMSCDGQVDVGPRHGPGR